MARIASVNPMIDSAQAAPDAGSKISEKNLWKPTKMTDTTQ